MKGSTMLVVSMTMVLIMILIGLVSVLPGISTASAMHIPPDVWPYPTIHSELEEAHDVSDEGTS